MKAFTLRYAAYPLLSLFALLPACQAQVPLNLPGDIANEPKIIVAGQTKLIRTQESGWGANVRCGLEDKNGNLWFGTSGEGVYRYDGKSFTHFTEKDGLGSNGVGQIYEDKAGTLWFCTGNAISRYDESASYISGVKPFSTLQIKENQPYTTTKVVSMLQDKTGNFWFGTNQGVFRYDGKSFTAFLQNDGVVNKEGLQLKYVSTMLEDKAGNIWFGSYAQEGVCRFDGRSISSFKPKNDGMIGSMLQDKNGNIWFGTKNHGACRYDGKTFSNFDDVEIFRSSAVFTIVEDKVGNIWFGTDGDGAWCYHPDTSVFSRLALKDGDGYNSVWSILVEKSGILWLGTRNIGLFRYDGKTLTDFSD